MPRLEDRETDYDASVKPEGRRLAQAVPHLLKAPPEAPSFTKVLGSCTTLKHTGCALAWLFVHAAAFKGEQKLQPLFFTMFTSTVWPRAERRRLALPLRLGDLMELKQTLLGNSFESCMKDEFTTIFAERCWILLASYACNTLHGQQTPLSEGRWNQAEQRAISSIRGAVQTMLSHGVNKTADPGAIEKDVKLSRVSYTGEELKSCHKLTLKQVEPALPPPGHGGCIDLLKFVSTLTQRFLVNPDLCVLPDKGQPLPKLQGRIHMASGDQVAISDLLVERGICCWTPLEDVARFRGQYLLNGLFGVEKSTKIDSGEPVLRLIMNLVPTNSVLLQLQGSVKNLPGITAWMSCVTEDNEQVHVWQSDMSNAFYLFRLPAVWAKYLSFNLIRKGETLGLQRGVDYALSCTVLPMGWLSSVSIMQDIAENLLLKDALDSEHQLSRNRPVPLWMVGLLKEAKRSGRAWWHVYLDNFAAGQVVDEDESILGGQFLHDQAERAWSDAQVISASKKRKSGVLEAEELGGFISGNTSSLGPSAERILKLIQATLWLLGRAHMAKKPVQVVAGRWVHVLQFRRPGMSFLESTWEFVGTKRFSLELVRRVRRELFACIAAAPLLRANLAAKVSTFTTASDASHRAGAVGIAEQLSPIGNDYLMTSLNSQRSGSFIPVLVISLFNGIGGAFRTYDVLGFTPMGLVSFDTHPPANIIG